MRVHFTELELQKNRDRLYLKDSSGTVIQSYTNSTATYDVWSSWINGNIVYLNMVTDASINYYGFRVDRYEYESSEVPLAGATVTLSPVGRTTVTGSDGVYSFDSLSAGSYTITPSLAGATFTPASRNVSVSTGQFLPNQNFTKN
jgi:hypothetical protein